MCNTIEGQKQLEPLFNWVGGKRRLIYDMQVLWNENNLIDGYVQERRLVEPFCGSAAVTFRLEPKCAVLNDINPYLINFLVHAQHDECMTIDLRYHTNEEMYYVARDRFNTLQHDIIRYDKELAQLFFTLVQLGYGHLWRVNSKGEFNVPFANRLMTSSIYRTYYFGGSFSDQWLLTSMDYKFLKLESTDFVYCDPPYYNKYDHYAKAGFSRKDHYELVEFLDNHPGPVVISNSETSEMINLYRDHGYTVFRIGGIQQLGNVQRAYKTQELLAMKNLFIPTGFYKI